MELMSTSRKACPKKRQGSLYALLEKKLKMTDPHMGKRGDKKENHGGHITIETGAQQLLDQNVTE